MKYKLLLAFAVICTGAVLIDANRNVYSNAAGAPAGCSGSPSDGTTCARSGCHTGSAVTPISGWITSNIPAGGYTPLKTYTITAKCVYVGRSKFGFEISPQDLSGNALGTMTPVGATTQVLFGAWITHRKTSNTATDSLSWTFNWTAPAYGSGPLTFYGSFNAANGNASQTGDLIYTSTLAVNEAPSPGVDAGIQSVLSPTLFGCSNSVSPVVKISNYGTTTLTSATISYHLDANTPQSLAWTGTLATNASQNVSLPAMTVTNGQHTFTAATSLPNSVADTITVNDSHTSSFEARLIPVATPYSEGFDTIVFPPPGWVINNPNNDTTWRRSSAFHSGTGSAFIDNYLYNNPGAIDELISPSFNLSTLTTPVLTFQHAYCTYDNVSSDTLVIAVSIDCGNTWSQLYKKFGAALATTTPTINTSNFVPTAAQWRFEFIDLGFYKTATNAIFKFVNINAYENNLYLDEIRVNNSLGIQEMNGGKLDVTVYPNPVTDQLSLNYELSAPSAVSVKIYNLQGREVVPGIIFKEKPAGKQVQTLDLKDVSSGMYILELRAGNSFESRRFVVSH